MGLLGWARRCIPSQREWGQDAWQGLGFRIHLDAHLPQVGGPAHRSEPGTDGQHAASAVPVLQAGTACTHRAAFLPHSGCAHQPAAAHGQHKGCWE